MFRNIVNVWLFANPVAKWSAVVALGIALGLIIRLF
jgi:hypothetical protein